MGTTTPPDPPSSPLDPFDRSFGPDSPWMQRTGRRCSAVRRGANVTLEELAAVVGLSRSTLSRIENGQQCPTVAQMAAIAHQLEVDIARIWWLPSWPDTVRAAGPVAVAS